MAREQIEDSHAFVTEVCWHYYVNEMTQAEIARQLNVTRLRVNQAIQRAKSLGFVKIQIESPFLPRVELQETLKTSLGLRRAVISPANETQYDYHKSVGAALAALMTERLATGDWRSFGVSWGLTLDATIKKLSRQSHPELEVVSILGGTAKGSTLNSFGIASGFANALGAQYSVLTAPIYLSEGIDRDLFLSQYALKEHFDKFQSLDAVLLTCSNVSEKSFLVENGLPHGMSPQSLIQNGAIGDVLGQFLDRNGHSVSQEVDNRTVGMPLDQVLGVPEKIMAAAGPHKVDIIRAACRRGFVDTLVTDDKTAKLLIAAGGKDGTEAR
ncbi:sugar-binding domain-containing protein [Marinovum sp. 2_MG-2023]|uniref:sugar-binding transcriptional regulator n=1 Tax=Roseobacteraceae TaxID=2854170 RepID=UPI001FD0D39A|nr:MULTISPECIES: sugar-binding domain-containing protein [Roseobacteraceae]MCJ7874398.1 transcriptional regulator [Phaeobacter sp. J2-8]MDO6731207.1 sugar-binding domain-containing protein [Marinovum sp. 2_MG-2023]MDO6780641.1 sugar-binding domain-containing protein [Marinovum sp. 1_MG-2023]